jgi:hypothetical protein
MAVDYADPQEVIMRAANAKMPVHLAGDLWKKIGREGWGERVTPSEATELLKQLAAKRASGDPPGDPSPGMTFIVDGLTLKDYYDLRDLRLLLMGLEKELIGKYGIIEAEPLSAKVRDLIKEKITEINNKIEASPEHHSNGDDPPVSAGNYVVRFNEGSPSQEDIEIQASSPEGATIEASRVFNTEHGEYPKTARIISPVMPSLAVESWQRRALGEERPPF